MTEDQTPLPVARKTSFLNEFYKDNQVILDRVLFAIIAAVLASVFHVKLSDINQDVNNTKDVATESATKADSAAKVGKLNEKLNTQALESIAKQTGDAQAAATVAEVKREAATQKGSP